MKQALVVEDEPHVAHLCVRLLARAGFQARAVGTAREAMTLLDTAREPLDLAYVDVGLPDASGLDVASAARRLRPSLAIVVASGAIEAIATPEAPMLCKPFTLSAFQQAIDEAERLVSAAVA
jgi:DNA-binding response OmpR family regulator